jgi:hypothetical protein
MKKKAERTIEQQNIRDYEARKLKQLRAEWKKNLAETMLKLDKEFSKDDISSSKNFEKYKFDYTKEWANKLIEEWYWWIVTDRLDKYEWIDSSDIADKLIKSWQWNVVAENLEKFQWLDHRSIYIKLMRMWFWQSVAENINKFKWLDYYDVAIKLIQKKLWKFVIMNIEKFDEVIEDSQYFLDVCDKLDEAWYWEIAYSYYNEQYNDEL